MEDTVRADIRAMHERLNDVDARMAALDANLDRPEVVRRTALIDVWDKMMESAQFEAATIVMQMIREVGSER